MTVKLTYENVKKYFKDHNCELLETENVNNNTNMKYRCECSNEALIRFSKFKSGQRCKKCSGKEKHTFDFVFNYFKEQGCELLETKYINIDTKMKYRCECGNESEITFGSFKNQNCRCMKCGGKEILTIEFVKEQFEKRNCELHETEYINGKTKMKYTCKCKNEAEITYNNFSKGQYCALCSNSNNIKLTYEEVYDYFKQQNCELLETKYINYNTKMKYKCNCGNIDYVTFGNFKNQDCRCNTCCWDKRKNTNKEERYGCEYPMQNAEVFENNKKSNYKSKVYEFETGRIEKSTRIRTSSY